MIEILTRRRLPPCRPILISSPVTNSIANFIIQFMASRWTVTCAHRQYPSCWHPCSSCCPHPALPSQPSTISARKMRKEFPGPFLFAQVRNKEESERPQRACAVTTNTVRESSARVETRRRTSQRTTAARCAPKWLGSTRPTPQPTAGAGGGRRRRGRVPRRLQLPL